jgi:hypothetical protein
LKNLTAFALALGLLACSRNDKPQPVDTIQAAPGSVDMAPMPTDTTTPKNLAGTRWRLVEIQSMDDKQGTTRAEPGKYAIAFDSEGGQVALQLDCQKARAEYSDKRSPDNRGGSMNISTVTVTCPAPSLASRIARDMGFVRSYRFQDGRLYMDLMADGGIYVWEKNGGIPVSER